ncbi:uncharacterized protein LOC110848695 [Folsomia candida]|uniref:uncharacterized protein LOC110848695 n=1 Tax=Folsomia candida TaxID=158441 RepID=UPI000B8FBF3D|nr:uncharacterized protein LOC110848695 [Folsomia candida]
MISYLLIFIVGFDCMTSCDGGIVGSKSKSPHFRGTLSTNASLCDAMTSATGTVSSTLGTAFDIGNNVICTVQNECRRLECISSNKEESSDDQLSLRFRIEVNICQIEQPSVQFRADGKSLLGENFFLTIPLVSRKTGRHKISEVSHRNIVLKVATLSKSKDDEKPQYIFTSSLQSCETKDEISCLFLPLLNLPYHHINACDHSKTKHLFSRHRSSRSTSAEMHTRRLVYNNDTTNRLGQPCDFSMLSCGSGGACVNKDGKGVCECNDFYVPAPNGTCVHPTIAPVTPTPETGGASTALDALLIICVLIALVSGAVYLGRKYQIFQRIRSRLPLSLRCWPFPMFRRQQTQDDNLAFAVPLD